MSQIKKGAMRDPEDEKASAHAATPRLARLGITIADSVCRSVMPSWS